MKSRPLLLTLVPLILIATVGAGLTNRWPCFSRVWAQSGQDSSRRIREISLPPPKHVDRPHVLAATYYNFDEKLTATLMLSNQGPHPMEARVSLFNVAGERLDAPPVMLLGTTAYGFDLREWAEAGGVSFHEGSLQVHYIGMPMELGGVVKLVDAERSLIFDEELTEPVTGSGSSRLEGVWWLRSRKSELHIAISNTAESVLTATITAIGEHLHLDAEEKGDERDGQEGEQTQPETMVLAAHETRVLDVRTVLSRTGEGKSIPRIGGVSIAHTGPKGGVLARGFIQESATGFSNVMEFHDPQTAKTWKLNGAGLRIGSVTGEALTQIAVARNIGNTPTVLTGHVAYAREDGTQGVLDLPEAQLAPGQTRAIPLAKAIQASGISGVATAGLEFEYSGVPGSVVMSALSVSSGGNQVFRVPLIDATSTNSAGTYPWSIDDTSSSFVYIKNVTDLPQRYTMTIRFDGGSYSLGLKMLEPHETATFDVRKLRDTKVPDVNGKTLPPEATHGQVHWSIHEPHNYLLIGRLEQADFANGLSMTASCTCCGNTLSQAWITPGYVSGSIGGSQTFLANETDWTCFGSPETWSFNPGVWSSDNTSVATVNGSSGQATAVGVGSAGIWGHWGSQNWFVDESAQPPQCISQAYPVDCNAQCDVPPTLSQDRPLWFFGLGNTPPSGFTLGGITATLTANGAGNGTYVWTITNGTSKAQFENNSSTITKTNVNTVGISSTYWSTQANDVTIQLKWTPSGLTQMTVPNYNLSIDSPYKLATNGNPGTAGVAYSLIPDPCTSIPAPQGLDGYQTLIPYSIRSFFGVLITNIEANEAFSKQADIYIGNNWPAYSVRGGLTYTGNFFENICIASANGGTAANPPTGPWPAGTAAVDYGSQFWFVGSSASGGGVEVQSDTLTRYQDHGTHTQAVSPIPGR